MPGTHGWAAKPADVDPEGLPHIVECSAAWRAWWLTAGGEVAQRGVVLIVTRKQLRGSPT